MPKGFDPAAFAAIPDPHIPEPGEIPLSKAEMADLSPIVRERINYLERKYAELSAMHQSQSNRLRKANWGNWSRSR